eukprot:110215-Hanusia_phi.AAC.2
MTRRTTGGRDGKEEGEEEERGDVKVYLRSGRMKVEEERHVVHQTVGNYPAAAWPAAFSLSSRRPLQHLRLIATRSARIACFSP